ncbi:hypothetical protein KUTeg_002657 [Tegillarca granosa]|uniref:Uncharacterized protein n=1 Tax=Tegillarca granosa TaxID=220873 RepID=A0ABQ9FXT8_TEGGR|nr:hypothetical protein KUTeg_002657 [Tegillarca granosa]
MDSLAWCVLSLFRIALMLVQLTLATESVQLTYVFCDQGIHRIALGDGESKYFTWDGQRLSKYDFSDCDLWLSGTDRKTSDGEEWTVCITVEEYNITDCDVKITYELKLANEEDIKTYGCDAPPPDNYCTKNIILKMGVTAMKDSTSHFKVKMSATQHTRESGEPELQNIALTEKE